MRKIILTAALALCATAATAQPVMMDLQNPTDKLPSEGASTQAASDVVNIVIKDHKFSPAEVTVPAGKTITLNVDNQDATPEEFESHDLKREKVIPGNSQAKIVVGPLTAGAYKFVGEFNEDSAKGVLIAK